MELFYSWYLNQRERIILNFDNKNLKTPKEYKVFWDVIKRELLCKGDYVSKIDKSISEEKIRLMSIYKKKGKLIFE